jgi:DNA-directed RNA polymerase subunit M/transcription elongation factor TFIIS
MPGIVIPHDRTTRQRVRGYCLNLECRESSDADRFEFDVEHDRFACPKCGNDRPPGVGLLVLTHLLIRDRKGPILGDMGLNYRLACHKDRAYLATITNLEAATGDITFCNCPGCLKVADELKITTAQGVALTPRSSTPLASITL